MKTIYKWIIGGGILALILSLSSCIDAVDNILTKSIDLPQKMKVFSDKMSDYYYEPGKWNGTWSAFPEGLVNMGDYSLSDTDVIISLTLNNGVVSGEIVSKEFCKKVHMLDMMINGEINLFHVIRADVIAIVKGETRKLGRIKINYENSDGVVTVTPLTDPLNIIGDKPIRLIKNVGDDGEGGVATNMLETMNFCHSNDYEWWLRALKEYERKKHSSEKLKSNE
ncbi:hypothetical protein [Pectobacterium aroidearum]|uniref:hypothetical protein n=1 Tax=Pectobacterium aroidearum TaxID=1201031 RepID=UPI0032ED9C79